MWNGRASVAQCTTRGRIAVFPTVRDVAERAGVSPSTVSRVIADHPRISEATKQRVRIAMGELNYHPNAIARSLVSQRSNTIGVVMSRSAEAALANPFFSEVLRGIGAVAQQERYTMMLTTATSYEDEYKQSMALLRQRRSDGLILLTSRRDDPLVKRLQKDNYPFVVLGRVPGDEVPYVNNDNVAAARAATRHLLELGHERIAFLGGPPDLILSVDRLAGYEAAFADADIGVDHSIVKETDFSYDAGYDTTRRLLKESSDVTAVLAVDDMLALGALAAARDEGLRLPEQLSVVGFNDTPVCPHVDPALTSVSIPIFDLGKGAARMLCDMFAGVASSRTLLLPAQLVVRSSTAPAQGPKRRRCVEETG